MAKSTEFYGGRGLTVATSYGSKYIEFDAAAGAIKLGPVLRAR